MRRVFLHIGLPKTGTSYLQSILWSHRDELRSSGVLLPGRERRDHLWASLVVREDPNVGRRNPRAPEAWDVLRKEIRGWHRDALISHEFFCSATAEQARTMVAALTDDGAEVHLVVTAREPLSLFTSSWQEHLKNKGTATISEYAATESDDPNVVWNWRALDLRLVLGRWGSAVAGPALVHVVTAPGRDQPRDELWRRFCSVLGLSPGIATPRSFANASMGVVEAETLRRINLRLEGFDRAFDRGVWIRSFLADDRLVPRGGEPYWPGDEQIADARRRGEEAVSFVRDAGFDVVGDLDALRVPASLPERRHPDSVTDAEVADVAVDLVADLLGEVRARSSAGGSAPQPRAGLLRRWRDRSRKPPA
jgi:hypothetical protein